jgi:S1-C subfamily serine protease
MGACAVNERDDRGWKHLFSVEPVVRAMDPEGPAAGQLKAGDAIVAVDRYLITTAEGGRRLANVWTGVAVVLRIRRNGREHSITLIPAAGCNEPGLTVKEPPPGS